MVATIDATEIELGICEATLNGVKLGATKNSVKCKITENKVPVTCQNFGPSAPLKVFENGQGISVTFAIMEQSWANRALIYSTMTEVVDSIDPAKIKGTIGTGTGDEAPAYLLRLHPQQLADGTRKPDLTIYQAVVTDISDFEYSAESEKVISITMIATPDPTKSDGDWLGCIGDSSAT